MNVSENHTRVIKLTELVVKYMLLKQMMVDTSTVFVQCWFGTMRTLNLTGVKRVQESEFLDGLRMSVTTEQSLKVRIDLWLEWVSLRCTLGCCL